MTDQQLEKAAREYCRLTGENPDEQVGHGADANEYGVVPAVMLYSPRWTRVARHIKAHWLLQESIRVGLSS